MKATVLPESINSLGRGWALSLWHGPTLRPWRWSVVLFVGQLVVNLDLTCTCTCTVHSSCTMISYRDFTCDDTTVTPLLFVCNHNEAYSTFHRAEPFIFK